MPSLVSASHPTRPPTIAGAAKALLTSALLASAILGAGSAANASQVGMPANPVYSQECGACHVPYAPALLPAASWRRVMAGLDKHFGTDASLEAKERDALAAYLQQHAGSYKRVSEEPPQDRITRSAWFLRKHREGEVPANVWKRASVGSPANCNACHAQAAQGNFNEHEVRIPR